MKRLIQGVLVSCGIVFAHSAAATPWADADDLQVRHHLQILADAGVVRVSANTYPLMWGALLETLRDIRAADLTATQRWSYDYLMGVIEFHQVGGYTAGRLSGQLRNDAEQGFGQSADERAALTIVRDFKTDHSAFRLQTSFRSGRQPLPFSERDPQVVSLAGSYAATVVSHDWLGSWVLSADQLETWWSPSFEHDGMHTRSERPLQSLRVTRAGAAPFSVTPLSWLGPWSLTAYAGRSERSLGVADADERAREEAFGLRVTAQPLTRVQVGARYTGAHLGYTQKNAAVDVRVAAFSHENSSYTGQVAVYGEMISHTSEFSESYHTIGVDYTWHRSGEGVEAPVRVYAEQLRHVDRDVDAFGVHQFQPSGFGWDARVRDIHYHGRHWRRDAFFDRYLSDAGLGSLDAGLGGAGALARQQVDLSVYIPLQQSRLVVGAQWWRDEMAGFGAGSAAASSVESGDWTLAKKTRFNVLVSWEIRW